MPTEPTATAAPFDPLAWTINMTLSVDLPCLKCGRTERCRCHVPRADRDAQRAAYIAARVRERFPDDIPAPPTPEAVKRAQMLADIDAADEDD